MSAGTAPPRPSPGPFAPCRPYRLGDVVQVAVGRPWRWRALLFFFPRLARFAPPLTASYRCTHTGTSTRE